MPSLTRPAALTRPAPAANGHTEDGRRERLALNVADLTRLDPAVAGMLLGGCLGDSPVRTDPDRLDEAAVPLVCPLLQAACLADTVRAHDRRAGHAPTRVYLSRGNGWVKLNAAAVLVRLVAGQPVLDPAVFPPRVSPGDLAAPAPAAVIL